MMPPAQYTEENLLTLAVRHDGVAPRVIETA